MSKSLIIIKFFLLFALGKATAQSVYQPSEAIKQAQTEFQDKKFGIFLHQHVVRHKSHRIVDIVHCDEFKESVLRAFRHLIGYDGVDVLQRQGSHRAKK